MPRLQSWQGGLRPGDLDRDRWPLCHRRERHPDLERDPCVVRQYGRHHHGGQVRALGQAGQGAEERSGHRLERGSSSPRAGAELRHQGPRSEDDRGLPGADQAPRGPGGCEDGAARDPGRQLRGQLGELRHRSRRQLHLPVGWWRRSPARPQRAVQLRSVVLAARCERWWWQGQWPGLPDVQCGHQLQPPARRWSRVDRCGPGFQHLPVDRHQARDARSWSAPRGSPQRPQLHEALPRGDPRRERSGEGPALLVRPGDGRWRCCPECCHEVVRSRCRWGSQDGPHAAHRQALPGSQEPGGRAGRGARSAPGFRSADRG